MLDEILAAVEDFEYEAAAAAAEKFAERCADMLVKTGFYRCFERKKLFLLKPYRNRAERKRGTNGDKQKCG